MSVFVRESDGTVAMVLDIEEGGLIAQLADQLTAVLTDATAMGATDARTVDPAIARLLPDGYQDDDEAAAEFRRFTSEGLLSGKVATALAVRAALPGFGEVAGADGVDDDTDGDLDAAFEAIVGTGTGGADGAGADGSRPAQFDGAVFAPDADEEIIVRLDDETAWTWLRFLTDVRLTLAARLGIEDDDEDEGPFDEADDDEDEEASEDTPLMMAVYGWLGYLQESIVMAIDEPA
ncbi:DUF2017 family protein [Plantibacter sp. YIM 135249]|jgi:hypothetical protein|uniref:DUF2017 family protein n=1 Tax=Plantibacter sp. YIM 135249 TaxID=3423918 RepID=UPI003D324A40